MKIIDDRYDALMMEISRHLRKNDGFCEIHSTNYWRGRGARTFGVNWAACGTQDPARARDCACMMLEAAEIAEWLNDLKLETVYTEEPTISSEKFAELRWLIRELIEGDKWDELAAIVREWEV